MKTLRSFFSILVVLLLGTVAFAAVTVAREERVMHFKNGIYVGSGAAVAANKVTKSLAASTTYDPASITATCTESSAITVTGAAVGDPCTVGVPAANGALNVSHTCYVSAASAVTIKVCNPTAGAIDGASGTFYVRVTSSQ